MTEPDWKEHGYYEVSIPVWNPNESEDERTVRHLTIDIVANEEKLEEISTNLNKNLQNYGKSDADSTTIEQTIGQKLRSILRNNLIFEASCKDHDINTVEELESRLENDNFEVFPL